jgi:hypothetical protein
VAVLAGLAAAPAAAEAPVPGLTDLGGSGLVTIPSARLLPEGTMAPGVEAVGGLYVHTSLSATPLEWLEATLRQTWRPSPDPQFDLPIEAGLDLKLRLLTESRWRPALALALRDLTGGRFSSEALVLSKRWYDWDFTLGLGWGRLGEAGQLGNPLGWLGGRFERERPSETAPAGPGAWFTGDHLAPLAGLAWQTPVPDLVFRLDTSGDRLERDRRENPALVPGIPLNLGLSWQPWPWLDLGAGWVQGRRALLRATLLLQPGQAGVPAVPPAALPAPSASVAVAPAELVAWVDPTLRGAEGLPPAQVVGHAARELAAAAPPGVEQVTVIAASHGLEGVAVSLNRRDLAPARRQRSSAEELAQSARFTPGPAVSAAAIPSGGWVPPPRERLRWFLTPRLEQSLFEWVSPLAYRAALDGGLEWQPRPGLVIGAGLRAELAHDLETLDASLLPLPPRPVRSDLVEFVTAAPLDPEHFHATWLAAPAPELTTRLSAGWFEEMYGGLGGELLYRPWQGRWAAGLEIDRVWKRYPGNTLVLRADSPMSTGHVSLYYDSESADVTTALHVGRYLGGDWGATLELTRRFDNGVRLGAELTGTGGIADGWDWLPGWRERSRFTFGLTLSVPLGGLALVPDATRLEVVTKPLGRDGGQRLEMPLRLHALTEPASYGRVQGSWSHLLE